MRMELIEEVNPLDTFVTNKCNRNNNSNINSAGRPPNSKRIKFSEQPKSIISQQLLVQKQLVIDDKFESDVPPIPEINDNLIDHRSIEKTYKKDTAKRIKIYSCIYDNCSYSTKISSNMGKHKRTHSHEKLYLCDKCSFSTKFSNSLNVHMRLHSNEKPFYCQYCDYRCNSSSNLKKHRSHRHSDKLK